MRGGLRKRGEELEGRAEGVLRQLQLEEQPAGAAGGDPAAQRDDVVVENGLT